MLGIASGSKQMVKNVYSIIVILLISLFLGAGAAEAQNLVTNGDFISGISYWHLVGRGTLSHNTDGTGSTGSLQAEGGLAGNATQAVAGQCIPVSASKGYRFSASVRAVSGTPSYCRIALFESERSDCRWLELGAEVRRTTFSAGWEDLAGGTIVTASGTSAIELRLHCATAEGDHQALEVRFDAVVVEAAPFVTKIFSDDFESGGTANWSSTVP
jgi:hypothetical protein